MCHSWKLSTGACIRTVCKVKYNPFVLEIHSSPETVHIHYTPLIFIKGYIALYWVTFTFYLNSEETDSLCKLF